MSWISAATADWREWEVGSPFIASGGKPNAIRFGWNQTSSVFLALYGLREAKSLIIRLVISFNVIQIQRGKKISSKVSRNQDDQWPCPLSGPFRYKSESQQKPSPKRNVKTSEKFWNNFIKRALNRKNEASVSARKPHCQKRSAFDRMGIRFLIWETAITTLA